MTFFVCPKIFSLSIYNGLEGSPSEACRHTDHQIRDWLPFFKIGWNGLAQKRKVTVRDAPRLYESRTYHKRPDIKLVDWAWHSARSEKSSLISLVHQPRGRMGTQRLCECWPTPPRSFIFRREVMDGSNPYGFYICNENKNQNPGSLVSLMVRD